MIPASTLPSQKLRMAISFLAFLCYGLSSHTPTRCLCTFFFPSNFFLTMSSKLFNSYMVLLLDSCDDGVWFDLSFREKFPFIMNCADIFICSLCYKIFTNLIGYSTDYLAKCPNVPEFESFLV